VVSPGEIVGNYRILRRIGGGGMGDVYLGEHVHMGRHAAVKVLLPELSTQEQAVARFLDEARATARLRHPGIIEVLDCGLYATGAAYIVMEYLVGENLGDYLARAGGLAEHPRAVAAVMGQIADALTAAHENGIIHRDLKPDNLFLCASADSPSAVRVKVLDFGIAKLVAPKTGEARRTRTGSLLGTPLYMSPEQCRGSGQIDFRTDIYSLGCIIFEMMAGVPPFVREGAGDLIVAHVSEQPPELTKLVPSAPPILSQLVKHMLAKDRELRPASMREVARQMEAFLGAPVSAFPSLTALPIVSAPHIDGAQRAWSQEGASPGAPVVSRTAHLDLAAGSTPTSPDRTQPLSQGAPSRDGAGRTQILPDEATLDRRTESREPRQDAMSAKRRPSHALALSLIALAALAAAGYRYWHRHGGSSVAPDRDEARVPAFKAAPDPSDLDAVAPFLQSPSEPAFPDGCRTSEPALVKRLADAIRDLSPGAGDLQQTRGRQALDSLPDTMPERWMVATRKMMTAAPKMAEQASARAVSLCSTSAVAHNLRGNALQILQQLGLAEREYREASQKAPDWLAPQFNLGLLRLRSNDARGALDTFARIARARPDYPSIHLVLADAHRQLGDRGAAVADLEAHVKFQPADGEGWLQLGRALHAHDPRGARAAFCHAASLGQTEAAALCPH
jgi:serine/threonine protein kinase/tetratricopeptide (TPR) repeat protein